MKENHSQPARILGLGCLWRLLWDLSQLCKGSKMTTKMKTPRIALIKARWHADIVDRAHDGFVAEAAKLMPDAVITAYEVPGAFEMPLLARKLGETGQYDAIVAVALVVDGGIYRHDFVASAVVDGLMTAQMATGVPVFSVSLTPHNFQPVDALIQFYQDHFVKKGAEAAHAVKQVLDLNHQLAQIS